MWINHTLLLFPPIALEQVEYVFRLSSMLLNDFCTLLNHLRYKIWGQTWCLGLPSQVAKSCVLLILFSGQYMEELIRLRMNPAHVITLLLLNNTLQQLLCV